MWVLLPLFNPLPLLPTNHPSPIFQCALAIARWKHDIVFTLDAYGEVRALEIRPTINANSITANCHSIGLASTLPVPGEAYATRFGVAAIDEAPPTLTTGSMSAPLPGQREVSEADVIRARASIGGTESSTETVSALNAAAQRVAEESERNKTLFQRLQPYFMPVGIFLALQMFMGGGGGKDKKVAAAAAAARPA
jgi:hypothetical protein